MKYAIFALVYALISCNTTKNISKYPTGIFVSNSKNEPITRIKIKKNGTYKLKDKTYDRQKHKFVRMKHKDIIHFNDSTQEIELVNCESYNLNIRTNDTLTYKKWYAQTLLHRANFWERISNFFIKKIPYKF